MILEKTKNIYPKKGVLVMKYFNKLMVFFLFMLFGYGVDTFAPTYTIFNMTGKNIEVKPYFFSETTGKGGIGEAQLIRSNDTYRFSEPDTCLTKIPFLG